MLELLPVTKGWKSTAVLIDGTPTSAAYAVHNTAAGYADRMCFFLHRPTDSSQQLYVDTENYRPMLFRNPGSLGWPPLKLSEVVIDWNADLNISVAKDAERLSEEDFVMMAVYMAEVWVR